MHTARIGFLIFVSAIFSYVVCYPAHAADDGRSDSPIVMVCAHGTVKSVMASEYFNSEAMKRGLPIRSISRGVAPDAKVPDKIANALAADGFDVSNFEPRTLTLRDATDSSRLVAIGVDLSDFRVEDSPGVVQWDDIPPASVDYEASKTAMIIRIHELLDELEKKADR